MANVERTASSTVCTLTPEEQNSTLLVSCKQRDWLYCYCVSVSDTINSEENLVKIIVKTKKKKKKEKKKEKKKTIHVKALQIIKKEHKKFIGHWKVEDFHRRRRLEIGIIQTYLSLSLFFSLTVNTQSYHHHHHHHHHHLHYSALSVEIPGGFELKLCSNTCTKSFSLLNLLCNLKLVILIFLKLGIKGYLFIFIF